MTATEPELEPATGTVPEPVAEWCEEHNIDTFGMESEGITWAVFVQQERNQFSIHHFVDGSGSDTVGKIWNSIEVAGPIAPDTYEYDNGVLRFIMADGGGTGEVTATFDENNKLIAEYH